MENIIISRTVDYGSKGELLIEKNGKTIVEVVDPKSLRQIIEYAKNNFYKLEDMTIDEENLSFKYGKYKVTFEFYKSYDFIRNNIRNLKNNKPKQITFINRRDVIIDFAGFRLKLKEYDSYLEINNLLSEIMSQRQNASFHIKGDNLYTKVDEIIIKLENYKKFSANRNFRYIFEKIQKQKVKVVRDTIIVGILTISTTVTGGIFLKTTVDAEDKNEYQEPETKLEIKVPMPEHITTEEYVFEPTYVDSEPDTLATTIPTKTTTEIQNKETDKYDELKIGSLANDEKLLTTKRLYSDIIEKYATKYGLDPELILAVATQERGVHSSQIDEDGAIGLMQVQVDVWENESLTVFDYELNKDVTIQITMDKLKSLEGNIETGCAILSHYINLRKGNILAALQTYNNGPGTMDTILSNYSLARNKTVSEILLENDLGWLDYRSDKYPGDHEYVEHVGRYYVGDIRNLEPNNGKQMS